HREHLDTDVFRARGGEEAPRLAAVEDEVAVGEVVHDRRAGLARVSDRVLERAVASGDGARVRRVVQVDGRDLVARGEREGGLPVRTRVERHRLEPGPRKRRAGRVVRVPRIGQYDG